MASHRWRGAYRYLSTGSMLCFWLLSYGFSHLHRVCFSIEDATRGLGHACSATTATKEHELVQIEYHKVKAESLLEKRAFDKRFPELSAKAGENGHLGELVQYVRGLWSSPPTRLISCI